MIYLACLPLEICKTKSWPTFSKLRFWDGVSVSTGSNIPRVVSGCYNSLILCHSEQFENNAFPIFTFASKVYKKYSNVSYGFTAKWKMYVKIELPSYLFARKTYFSQFTSPFASLSQNCVRWGFWIIKKNSTFGRTKATDLAQYCIGDIIEKK